MNIEILLLLLVVLGLLVLCVQLARSRRGPGAESEVLERALREELRVGREEASRAGRELREEVGTSLKSTTDSVTRTMGELGKLQKGQLEAVTGQVKDLAETNHQRIDRLRESIDKQLTELREGNEKKLEEMRITVDEKLQTTLEKRLGESFKLVGDRLEAVQRGLGEMQNLATGVGDLKRVLPNVKLRGTWAEYQLGAILEQILTPDQFDENVATRAGSAERVEYAVRLPGPSDRPGSCVWLPIDSKFPHEDYDRLVEAAERSDKEAVEKATRALLRAIEKSAGSISSKYLDPPATTDFALMFLPTEGLYAEVLREPGFADRLQQQHRVLVAGPTNLAALLNSLRMGFRTLAIERRASEVWQVLAAVKTEFGKFGNALSKVKKQLDTASRSIDETGTRTRAMERRLRDVEQLPEESAVTMLGLPAGNDAEAGLELPEDEEGKELP